MIVVTHEMGFARDVSDQRDVPAQRPDRGGRPAGPGRSARRSRSAAASSSPSTSSSRRCPTRCAKSSISALFWEYRAVLLRGLAVNFYVFFAAAALALGIGLAAALLRVSRFRPLRWVGTLHVEMFRNAPDYVMVVWVHFVLPLLIGPLLGTAARVRSVRVGGDRAGLRLQRLLRRDVPRRHRGDPGRPPRGRARLRHVGAADPAGASSCRRSCAACCRSRSTSSSRCSRPRRSCR